MQTMFAFVSSAGGCVEHRLSADSGSKNPPVTVTRFHVDPESGDMVQDSNREAKTYNNIHWAMLAIGDEVGP